jgi:hypothetical protein
MAYRRVVFFFNVTGEICGACLFGFGAHAVGTEMYRISEALSLGSLAPFIAADSRFRSPFGDMKLYFSLGLSANCRIPNMNPGDRPWYFSTYRRTDEPGHSDEAMKQGSPVHFVARRSRHMRNAWGERPSAAAACPMPLPLIASTSQPPKPTFAAGRRVTN